MTARKISFCVLIAAKPSLLLLGFALYLAVKNNEVDELPEFY
jgi:hypothetical protein